MKPIDLVITAVLLAAGVGVLGCDTSHEQRYKKVVLLDGSVHFMTQSEKCYFPAWCTTFYEVGGKEQP